MPDAGRLPDREARITRGYRLPARFVIHTVGPVWRGGGHGEAEKLAGCYRSSLAIAREHAIRSIAFPAISTGVYGYPIPAGAEVAASTVAAVLREAPEAFDRILFVCFSAEAEAAYAAAIAAAR